jgi:plasmid maintenance system antidote protein VapI
MSIRELSLQADIPYSVAHRFVTGGAGITLQTAAKIATVLGLELRPKKKREQHADAEAESTE